MIANTCAECACTCISAATAGGRQRGGSRDRALISESGHTWYPSTTLGREAICYVGGKTLAHGSLTCQAASVFETGLRGPATPLQPHQFRAPVGDSQPNVAAAS